ncbi:MAG TPA: hypothetical protein VLK56_04545 [Solirubrobacterales bacterium]|nr:hypothetical protein [Solirubrobacterales bacterium]
MARLEQEAHRIAAQALSQQEQALTELRTRTGTLLTAASLIASFLGGQALAREGLSAWVILALAAFGVSVTLCIYVLLPKDGLIFALDAPETYSALYEIRDDHEEVDRRLAYWLQSFREENHPTVERLTNAFELAGFALLVEIAFLAVGLAVS